MTLYEPGSSEQLIEEKIDRLVTQMDELLTLTSVVPDAVARQAIGIGQIAFRANLVLSFLEAMKEPKLKVVSNHG